MGYTELDKHIRYKKLYKPNQLYWGIGIEEETYLQFTKYINVTTDFIKNNHRAERYSVKYFDTYHPTYKAVMETIFNDTRMVALPFFMNAHAFNRMDSSGNHTTTYEKDPKPNPAFSGKTFFEQLSEFIPKYWCFKPKTFSEYFDESCVFDGDSIEFMTQNFYKAKVKNVISELVSAKKNILNSINTFLKEKRLHRDKGLLMYPPVNPGFAVFYTNPTNVAMFNNGTYHINITLPTLLGDYVDGIPEIINIPQYNYDHKRFIRLIQWMEPLIIAVYGTKDPLSDYCDDYSKASQRCAVSRYIGIGTYDTENMPTGKIITLPIEEIRGSQNEFWWYKQYHKDSGYLSLKKLGMDISFRKHYNHGVEIRFLDWFPEENLKDLIEFYVHLGDVAMVRELAPEANMSEVWNNLLVKILQKGEDYILPASAIKIYEEILGLTIKEHSVKNILVEIMNAIKKKEGLCEKLMI